MQVTGSGCQISDMAVLLTVVFALLVYTAHVTGQTLCDTDGMLEVVENATDNVFTCTGGDIGHTVTWLFIQSDGSTATMSVCPTPNEACTNTYSPYLTASRRARDKSTLTMDGSTISFKIIQGRTLICKKQSKSGSSQQTECQVDVIAIPSVTCDAHYNTGTSSPWTVTVNCSVSGAYSYLNRYTCQLVQTSPSTKNLGSVNMTVTSTTSGKYKSGTCDVTVSFSDVTGVYRYKMVVTPGKKNVNAMFGGQGSFEIKRPSTPPTHNCPQYVEESHSTNCTCTSTDPGQPAGVIKWTTSSASQLLLSNVKENQHQREYRCEIHWNRQIVQSVTYTLQVALPPSIPTIQPPINDYPFIATVTRSASLTCHSSTPGRPSPIYMWPITQGGREGTDDQGRGTLTFDTASNELDGKTVSCRARNRFTDAVPDGTLRLEVYYQPIIRIVPVTDTNPNQCQIVSTDTPQCVAIEGQKIHFRCSASSKPPPAHVTWQSDHGVNSDLYIESANRTQHTGTYNCTVTTRLGNRGNDPRLPLRSWRSFTVLVIAETKTSSASTSFNGPQSCFSVWAGIGVTVAIMILIVVVVVIWLWRRDWVLPCAEASRMHADDEMGHGKRTDMQQFNEEISEENAGVYELQDSGEPNTPVDLNPVPSEYDLLQTSDVGLKSVYSSLTLSNDTTGATGDTDSSYQNNSETSAVYVNKDNQETSPVYVNKDNQETRPVYVNRDNSKSGPYVNISGNIGAARNAK